MHLRMHIAAASAGLFHRDPPAQRAARGLADDSAGRDAEAGLQTSVLRGTLGRPAARAVLSRVLQSSTDARDDPELRAARAEQGARRSPRGRQGAGRGGAGRGAAG
jgi:hypothetical protein